MGSLYRLAVVAALLASSFDVAAQYEYRVNTASCNPALCGTGGLSPTHPHPDAASACAATNRPDATPVSELDPFQPNTQNMCWYPEYGVHLTFGGVSVRCAGSNDGWQPTPADPGSLNCNLCAPGTKTWASVPVTHGNNSWGMSFTGSGEVAANEFNNDGCLAYIVPKDQCPPVLKAKRKNDTGEVLGVYCYENSGEPWSGEGGVQMQPYIPGENPESDLPYEAEVQPSNNTDKTAPVVTTGPSGETITTVTETTSWDDGNYLNVAENPDTSGFSVIEFSSIEGEKTTKEVVTTVAEHTDGRVVETVATTITEFRRFDNHGTVSNIGQATATTAGGGTTSRTTTNTTTTYPDGSQTTTSETTEGTPGQGSETGTCDPKTETCGSGAKGKVAAPSFGDGLLSFGDAVAAFQAELNKPDGFSTRLDLLGDSIPSGGGTCPEVDLDLDMLGVHTMDEHCVLAEDLRPLLRAIFLAFWAISAVVVFMRA